MSKVLALVTYKTAGYTSTYERSFVGATRKECTDSISSFLTDKGSGLRDVKVFITEAFEEFTAERIWNLTLVSTTSDGKVVAAPPHNSLEV